MFLNILRFYLYITIIVLIFVRVSRKYIRYSVDCAKTHQDFVYLLLCTNTVITIYKQNLKIFENT